MNANAIRLHNLKVFQSPLSEQEQTKKGRVRMKRKTVKRRAYEFDLKELHVIAEALDTARAATCADIEKLNGADAETLEPYIARKYRFASLQKRVFKNR